MAVGVALGEAHEAIKILRALPGEGALQGAGLAVDEAGLHFTGHQLAFLIHQKHAGNVAHAFGSKGIGLVEHEKGLAGTAVPRAGEADVGHDRLIHPTEELNGGAHGKREQKSILGARLN